MYKTLSAPIMVQWEVTPACNHNCIHCYNSWRTKAQTKMGNGCESAINEIVTQEILSNGVFALNITGGEPLLVIEQIAPLVEKMSRSCVQVMMNSNLTLLTRAKVQLLKECGVRSILVSVPSGDAKTCDQITRKRNSLKMIVRGISLAQEANIRVLSNMVVSKVNKGQIRETAKMIASLGIKHLAITKASDPPESKEFTSEILGDEEFRQMQKTLESVGEEFNLKTDSLEANPACAYGEEIPKQGYKFCSAGKTTCTIGFDGTVKPCNRVDIPYGNVATDGLRSCWLKMGNWRTDIWLPEKCAACRLKSVCLGGCKANAIRAFGDISMPDPLCTAVPIPQSQKGAITPPVDQGEVFDISPYLRQRPEDFGSILFLSLQRWIAVNHELSTLFRSKGATTITKREIAHALSINSNDVRATIETLVGKGVLLERKQEERR